MENLTQAAVIGGGVIGGGWVARLVLNGVDVRVYDPHPEAARIVGEIVDNAERAYRRITGGTVGPRGRLRFASSVAEAVREAGYIQESVPEREDLKHRVLREIDTHAAADALVGSSTSGLLPSRLQVVMSRPERFLVAHPFNPVYLLPVVELVAGERTSAEAMERTAAFLNDIGMKPMTVRKEIDAHVADRLLEAVWREALWLVRDGVATTGEIDDIIRYGFGLRWAQMGLFETYRVAGGEAGMRHFIRQFGPCLKWPWTRLTDVPELDDALVDRIATQSDAQSGHHSVRELERIRDDNLVDIMRALAGNDWGAGTVYRTYARTLTDRARVPPAGDALDCSRPLPLYTARVLEEWTDYNGHMTDFRYAQVFGEATDALLMAIGMDAAYTARGWSVYTLETHNRFLREVDAGTTLRVDTTLLGYDAKRMRVWHVLVEAGSEQPIATSEQMLLHVDTASARACAFGSPLAERLEEIWCGHRALAPPDPAGAGIRPVG